MSKAHSWMYEWRAKARIIFAHSQVNPNLRILSMYERAVSLDATQIISVLITKTRLFKYTKNLSTKKW